MSQHNIHKTVLITGCSSGLGLSMTKLLLAHDWRVIATARDLEKSTELLNFQHPLLSILKLDVTNVADREVIKDFIDNKLNGQLDCLINNAGYGQFGPLEELTEAQIRNQLEVNLFGVIFLTKMCLPALRQCNGRIINISSMLGYTAFPMQSLYVASKYALEGFSESLHYELAPHGVQVSLIEPGACQTRFGANAKTALPENKLAEYRQQNNNLSRFREKLAKRKNKSPELVAVEMLNLLNKPTMPIRKIVGMDANIIYYLRKMIPANTFHTMMRFFYKSIFQKAE